MSETRLTRESTMRESHTLHCAGWVTGTIGLGSITAKLAAAGWTPEAVAALIGAVASLLMAANALLKTTQPYFDRLMTFLEARRAKR